MSEKTRPQNDYFSTLPPHPLDTQTKHINDQQKQYMQYEICKTSHVKGSSIWIAYKISGKNMSQQVHVNKQYSNSFNYNALQNSN